MVTVKVLPLPTSLETAISPPRAWAMRRLMVSPRPVPPYCRVTEVSACTKGSKMASNFSAGMPTPVSITWMVSWGLVLSCTSSARTCTPPVFVNLMALLIRFMSNWRNREGSVAMVSGTPLDQW